MRASLPFELSRSARTLPRHACPLLPLCGVWPGVVQVGATGAFLVSPMSSAVTGITMYVDNGMHAMGMVQSKAVQDCA
jgi:hypothetical protein